MNQGTKVSACTSSKIRTMLAGDAEKQNCYTVALNEETGLFESIEGIILTRSVESRGEVMAITAGPAYIVRGGEHNGHKFGCLFHSVMDQHVVLAATVGTITPKNEARQPFPVLLRPQRRPDYALVKIDIALPGTGRQRNRTRELTLGSLVVSSSDSILIEYRGKYAGTYIDQAVLRLSEGEAVIALLSSGDNHRFIYERGSLVERPLSSMEYLEMRIDDALTQIYHAGLNKDEKKRQSQTMYVVQGMANLLGFKSMNQKLRLRLLHEFFAKVTEAQVDIVRGKLQRILEQCDPALLYLVKRSHHTNATSDAESYAYQ